MRGARSRTSKSGTVPVSSLRSASSTSRSANSRVLGALSSRSMPPSRGTASRKTDFSGAGETLSIMRRESDFLSASEKPERSSA